MSIKPKSHKAMGDGEWMSRLRAFATTGLWPSGGNKPAPRQRKWYDLYQKIEKCPMQAHGQSTLFGGSKACNCGFHTVKQPATPAEAPQSVASDSDPGATSASAAASAATPRSFLRPPLSLSMEDPQPFSSFSILCEDPELFSSSFSILCEDPELFSSSCTILCEDTELFSSSSFSSSFSILCENPKPFCKHQPCSSPCEYSIYS
ncbi:uncharacterized protein LOC119886486 [Micropterus salmoides]|uniref:uncharacterized protein LOC119886486 n=1 Tax=Micropterus salmoides TaxID=27706 RepID=UPI0018EC8920|nr:uncharacterized protein LOC119886486 [Micropterus salmoides]